MVKIGPMISEGNFLNAINKDGQQVMAKAQKVMRVARTRKGKNMKQTEWNKKKTLKQKVSHNWIKANVSKF